MKARIIFRIFSIVILMIAAQANSQNGLETVYSDNQTGIRQFNSFKILNDQDKKIFIQTNADNLSWIGSKYYKLNKSNNSLLTPYNGFLNYESIDFCSDEFVIFSTETFVMSPSNENIIIRSNSINCDTIFNDEIYSFVNGTSSRLPFSNCAGMDIAANDSVFYVAGSNDMISYYIYKSTNRGVNWIITDTTSVLKRLTKGGLIKSNPLFPDYVYATGVNNLMVSTNAGYNFQNTSTPSFEKIYFHQNKMYGIISNKLYTSSDKGLNWNMIFSNLTFDFTCLEFTAENDQIIYAGTDVGLFRSTNNGVNFTLYNNAFPGSLKVLGLSKDPITNSPLYACTKNGIYKVLNSHYKPLDFISPFHIGNFFEYHHYGSKHEYYYNVIVRGDTILNNGIKYFKLEVNNTSTYTYEFIDTLSLKWYKFNPGCIYDDNELIIDFMADTGYIFNSCESIQSIIRKGNTSIFGVQDLKYSTYYYYPPPQHGNDQNYAEKFGFYRSYGYSFNIDLTGAIIDGVTYGEIHTSVKNISDQIPGKFELKQNYPNPFNPTTNLEFGISELGYVKLKIYDALGKEIQTLVNLRLSPGNYKVDFDGSNIASGVYYYKLEAGSFIETKRMILLK